MRLISADKLKDAIGKWLNPRAYIEEPRMVEVDDISISVIQEIDEQPTAYDVDKVVEQLEELSEQYHDYAQRYAVAGKTHEAEHMAGIAASYDNAIEIVKGSEV